MGGVQSKVGSRLSSVRTGLVAFHTPLSVSLSRERLSLRPSHPLSSSLSSGQGRIGGLLSMGAAIPHLRYECFLLSTLEPRHSTLDSRHSALDPRPSTQRQEHRDQDQDDTQTFKQAPTPGPKPKPQAPSPKPKPKPKPKPQKPPILVPLPTRHLPKGYPHLP